MTGTAIAKGTQEGAAELVLADFLAAIRQELSGPLPFRRWEELGEVLVHVHRVIERKRTLALLAIGDWLVYGREAATDGRLTEEERACYEERYAQAASLSGYEAGYLYNIATTAWRWRPSRRYGPDGKEWWPDLSLGHFQAVARLDNEDPKKAEQLLDAAQQGRWTRSQLRMAVSLIRQIAGDEDTDSVELPAPNGQDYHETSVVDIPTLAGRLRSLFLDNSTPAAARAGYDMPSYMWEKITTEFLATLTARSEYERRQIAVEVG